MDRPSQQPPEPPDAAESPLSFPVEVARPAGPEPGSDLSPEVLRSSGVEPVRDAPPQAESLSFPFEAPRPAGPEPGSGATAEVPRATPSADPGRPSAQLPYPVAQLPGMAAQPSQPVAERVPVPELPPASALRFLAPALAVAAALMVLLGSFLPLFVIQQYLGGREATVAGVTANETAWGTTYEVPGQDAVDQGGAPVGIPLLFAVAVLTAAALVAFPRPGGALGRWLIAAGAVFTAGVVATIGMTGIGWSVTAGRNDLLVSVAPGMWLLIAGAVVAAAAAVLAHLPVRGRGRAISGWADPAVAYADTPTPPSGVAITVLPPEPEDDQRG